MSPPAIRALFSLFSLLLACRRDDPVEVNPPVPDSAPSPSATDLLTEEVARLAQRDGFTVGNGLFSFATYEHCCEADVNCLGNNPSTPYGMVALPPSPGQDEPDSDSFWMWGTLPEAGLSRSFRMRDDEAYVWIGTMPPESKYFSYRSSIATRQFSGQREFVLGSLGPSLNQLTVAADLGLPVGEVWGRQMAMVTAADGGVEASVVAWLLEAGIPAADIHLDRVSAPDTQLGLSEASDTLMGVMRVAIALDEAAFLSWQQQGARVLRLTPPDERATAPLGRQPLPPRGNGVTEALWLPALTDLDEAIRDRWPDLAPRRPAVIEGFTETFDCIADISCFGDIRDRYATRTFDVWLRDDEAFIVVFGVNHERTGKSVYSNFAVQTYDNRVGVAAVESSVMAGSARPYLGEDYPLVDDMYAWVVSRDCNRFDLPCLEVEDTCPYPEPAEAFYVTSRMYLDPVTGVAAGDGEILADRVIEFGGLAP